jgi:hypothetical protein
MDVTFEIDEAEFPEATILSIRVKDSIKSMGKHIGGLYRLARERGLKPDGALYAVYYEKPEGEAPVDYELCLPVEGPTEELDKLEDRGGERLRRPGQGNGRPPPRHGRPSPRGLHPRPPPRLHDLHPDHGHGPLLPDREVRA